jgi:hypothetical protein
MSAVSSGLSAERCGVAGECLDGREAPVMT